MFKDPMMNDRENFLGNLLLAILFILLVLVSLAITSHSDTPTVTPTNTPIPEIDLHWIESGKLQFRYQKTPVFTLDVKNGAIYAPTVVAGSSGP